MLSNRRIFFRTKRLFSQRLFLAFVGKSCVVRRSWILEYFLPPSLRLSNFLDWVQRIYGMYVARKSFSCLLLQACLTHLINFKCEMVMTFIYKTVNHLYDISSSLKKPRFAWRVTQTISKKICNIDTTQCIAKQLHCVILYSCLTLKGEWVKYVVAPAVVKSFLYCSLHFCQFLQNLAPNMQWYVLS